MSQHETDVTRRKVLGITGAALTTAVAGCSSDSSGGDDYESGDGGNGDENGGNGDETNSEGNGDNGEEGGDALELKEHELVEPEEEYGSPTVEGTVENTGDEMKDYVEVRVRVYDADGNQLDNYFTNTTDLDGGKSWAFEVMIMEDMEDIDDYDITVKDDPF